MGNAICDKNQSREKETANPKFEEDDCKQKVTKESVIFICQFHHIEQSESVWIKTPSKLETNINHLFEIKRCYCLRSSPAGAGSDELGQLSQA